MRNFVISKKDELGLFNADSRTSFEPIYFFSKQLQKLFCSENRIFKQQAFFLFDFEDM